jgi:hypothetical protein
MTTADPTGSEPFPDWIAAYQAAIRETDNSVLLERILSAEQAIIQRQVDLTEDLAAAAELHDLEEALFHLRFLKQERLG